MRTRYRHVRVGGTQINTDHSAIVLDGVFLGLDGVAKERQGRNQNEKEVEDGGPSEGLGRAVAARYARHGDVYVRKACD